MLKRMKRKSLIVCMLIVAMLAGSTCMGFAGSNEYVALGADLSESDKATVFKLLGIDDINDYNVITITNADEHQYLDGHLDSAQIGNVSLSSVLIKDKIGSSIDVETYNISYCTEDMYRNALATAGVEGAKVKVAAPYPISGTAALVGAIKIYEQMSGETVDDEVIDAAVEELTTTGELSDSIGDAGVAEAIMASLKEQLAENPNLSDADLTQLIIDTAAKAGVTLSDADIAKIKSVLQHMQGLNINWSNVKSQSKDVLKNLKGLLDKVDINVDTEQAKGILARLVDWIKSKLGR